MEYEEFVRRFNARAKKRAEELEKATAHAKNEIDRIVASAKQDEKKDNQPQNNLAFAQEKSPARRHRKVQGILKQM